MATREERFWAKAWKRGANECWPWTGSLNTYGYGQIRDGGRDTSPKGAHVMSYEIHYGPVPAGHEVHHTCHDPKKCDGGPTCPHRSCVNPRHIEAMEEALHVWVTHSKLLRAAA